MVVESRGTKWLAVGEDAVDGEVDRACVCLNISIVDDLISIYQSSGK